MNNSMRMFLMDGNSPAFTNLEYNAKRGCVVYRNQEMPSTISPRQLQIGFEIGPNGNATLYVEKGGTYVGNSSSVAGWIRSGTIDFPDFQSLRNWLQSDLAPEYGTARGFGLQTPAENETKSLCDFAQVRASQAERIEIAAVDASELFDRLSNEIRGQDDTLRRLSARIVRHLNRIQPRRPATIFAVGPTGVGKTQTAESLAAIINQVDPGRNACQFLRLDMNEYQERHRVSQLLGSPQGYVGYGDGSQLSDQLARFPNSIVLFDEIEKAHPDVLKTLMNAMDAGRLSISQKVEGKRQIDCRKAIFFFTSNIESEEILREIETVEQTGSISTQHLDEICRISLRRAGIRPELVSRIGCFLAYRRLDAEARAEILALSIVRVAAEYDLKIELIEPETLSSLLDENEPSGFGTRPDEYLIDEHLGDTFSLHRRSSHYDYGGLILGGIGPYFLIPNGP